MREPNNTLDNIYYFRDFKQVIKALDSMIPSVTSLLIKLWNLGTFSELYDHLYTRINNTNWRCLKKILWEDIMVYGGIDCTHSFFTNGIRSTLCCTFFATFLIVLPGLKALADVVEAKAKRIKD